MMRSSIILLASVIFFSCGRGDNKQQEYVEEKPNVQKETRNDSLPVDKKPDTINYQSGKDIRDYTKKETHVVISPLNASEYMGKSVTVKGFVADVYRSDKVAYLNFIKKFPENPFSAVIFAREFEAFGDLNIYANKNVEVSGRISTYRGKPQMILDKPSQIKVVQ